MGAPTPSLFHARTNALRAVLGELVDEYRWAHDIAYAPGSSSATRIGGTRNRGSGDATGQAGISNEELRESLAEADKAVQQALTRLRGVRNTMLPRPNVTDRPDRFPRIISKSEREESQAAQARRLSRGAGYGSG